MNTYNDDSPPSYDEVVGPSAPESSIINDTGCERCNENRGRRYRVEQTNPLDDNQGNITQFNRGINFGQAATDSTSIDGTVNDRIRATNNGQR